MLVWCFRDLASAIKSISDEVNGACLAYELPGVDGIDFAHGVEAGWSLGTVMYSGSEVIGSSPSLAISSPSNYDNIIAGGALEAFALEFQHTAMVAQLQCPRKATKRNWHLVRSKSSQLAQRKSTNPKYTANTLPRPVQSHSGAGPEILPAPWLKG
jgi:hypothetical protein